MTENGEIAWEGYRTEGLKRAARLGNRGPCVSTRNEPGAAGRVGQDARRQPVRVMVLASKSSC